MKIGIYGGTFNPPHKGHTKAAAESVRQLGLDKLIVIPAGLPPHKPMAEGSPAAADRLALTRLSFAALKKAEVLDIEISRQGKSYTVDTITALRAQYPDAEFYLLMGTDMFVTLDQWKEHEKIVSMVTPAAFRRCGDDAAVLQECRAQLVQRYGKDIVIVDHDAIEISSSELRALLRCRQGNMYLEPAVYAEIIRHRYYDAKPSFEWLRQQAYAMLKPKRIPHVQGCEEEAARLAKRWGADVETAREAGILHDITKKCSGDEQLLLCEKYGIITDNFEKFEYKLLHAKTGAEIAKVDFGMSDDVYEAIKWHTTGKADMSLMEKIIYMADYIEPNRNFEGVDRLRKLAYSDLDAALCAGLEMSLEDMRARNIIPHWRSREALAYLMNETTDRKG